jgi:hypothetical protein
MLLAPVRSISSMKYNINRIDGIWVNYVFSCSNESDGRHASLQCHFWWRQWAQTRYLVPTACVRWLIPIDFEWGRTRNALWIRPFRWFRWRRQKVEQFSTFFGSDGSVIQSDRVCKFKHCDTTRALTTLESPPIRQPRLPTSFDGRCSGHEAYARNQTWSGAGFQLTPRALWMGSRPRPL